MPPDGTLLLESILITCPRLLPSDLELRPRQDSSSDTADEGNREPFQGSQVHYHKIIHLHRYHR